MNILFITLMDENYSRTWNYYTELKASGINCRYEKVPSRHLIKTLRSIKKEHPGYFDKVVIGSASQLVTLPTFLVFRKRPYLDAGWSLFEATKTNSVRSGFLKKNLIKTYFIDLVASILSKRIFLESELQRQWYTSKFPISKMKTEVIYTGVDESDFKPRINVHSTRDEYFRVIFRGKYNDEAGLEVLAEATRILKSEKIKFLILSKIRDSSLIFSANTQIIEDYFPNKSDIASLLAECDLSLGQLSSHDRLKRTIPHKAFESAYLGIPYLTARNPGILEIFEEGIEVFCFEPGSPISLAKQIRYLRENRQLLKVSSENLRTRYIGNFTQAKLSEKLLFELNS